MLEVKLMTVANAVAGVLTWTERLLGKTAATRDEGKREITKIRPREKERT
jgi:hypothetical protein